LVSDHGRRLSVASREGGDVLILVPKLRLGTPLLAKLSLANIFVPQYSLGTRGKIRFIEKKGRGNAHPFYYAMMPA